jgi:hypothetical protein
MMDGTSLIPSSPQRPPEGADSTIVTTGRETAGPRVPVMTWQGASDIVVRAPLSPANRYRVLTLPYPVEYQAFWQVLATMGVTKERLMDRMGASP